MSFTVRAALVAALSSTLLAGCSDKEPAPPATAGAASPAAWSDPAAAPRAAQVGKPGTPCVLPVSFDIAKSWKPAALPDGVAKQAGFTLRCEVDGKPAGHLGFLRVWVSAAAGKD